MGTDPFRNDGLRAFALKAQSRKISLSPPTLRTRGNLRPNTTNYASLGSARHSARCAHHATSDGNKGDLIEATVK